MNRANQAAPPLTPFLLDLPPLRDEHVDQPGFYFAPVQEDDTKPWRGCALYESGSPDSGFRKVGEFPARARAGRVVVPPLFSASVDPHMVDYASTIRVEMFHQDDELSSVDEIQMAAGYNRFLVGSEILGAATTRLIGANEHTGRGTYDLSTLHRALKDTVDEMDDHLAEELFLWLDGPGVYFVPHAAARINEPRYYKAVAGGGTVVEAIPVLLSSCQRTVQPFRPLSMVGTWDGSNNFTLTWQYQSRRSLQMDQAFPLDLELNRWKVQVMFSGSSSTVKRETVVLVADGATPSWTYTAGQQSSDFGSSGNNVTVEVCQLGKLVQEGIFARRTFAGS